METVNNRASTLLEAIKDSYRRMATNNEHEYRKVQFKKVQEWLQELTELYDTGTWIPGTEEQCR